jgi:glycerol-3-phosphate dehydrogenase
LLAGNLLKTNTGLLIPETRDGRVIFVLPYGDYLLAGTTDEEVTLTEKDFGPTRHDVDYILEYVNEYLDIHAGGNDVLAGFGGLRPLVAADENNTKDLVRDHIVEVDGYSGLISILGGKWTTYRLMARDTINAVAKQLHLPAQINPVKMKLKGSRHFGKNLLAEVKSVSGCDLRIAKHLVSKYGDQALMIAEMLRESTENHMIVEGLPYTYSELQYVIEQEMAVTVKDVINRRWGVEICNWQEASDLIDPVGAYMTSCFKWNEKQREEYIESYRQEIVAMIYAAKN